MADRTSVSIGFSTKEAQSEIRALSSAMKQTQNEFKVADATLKTTGSTLDRLQAKSQSLSTQVKQQSDITSKCEQAVKHYATAQESARQRLEKANAAYAKGKTELHGNKEELQKLKDEVSRAEKAVKSADNQYERWNNKLSQSRVAEANLRNELQQTSQELKKQSTYIAQVKDEYSRLSEKTAGVQKGLTATGKTLTASVTAPIVAAGAYAVKAFNDVDAGADIVIEKTGATGEAAKDLEAVYKQVANTILGEFTDIGSAVGEINTRLGFVDEKLKIASEDFLKFAKINKADVNTSVQLVTRAMGDASVPAEEYRDVLDAITVASQKSGISIESLTANLTKYGAPMRALGLSISDSIALFAAWEKSGVNTEIAFSGMKKAISNWGKDGKDSRIEFQKTMKEIKNAPSIAAATTKAIEVFGAKAGPDLADAIQGGRFEVSAYMEALENAAGTVNNTYNEIIDSADEGQLAIQKIKVAMSEAGEKVLIAAAPSVIKLSEAITGLINKFNELDEGTQNNIMKFLLFSAGVGPVLTTASKGISVFNGMAAAGKTLVKVLGGATTAATTAGAATAGMGTATTAAAAGGTSLLSILGPVALGVGGIAAAAIIAKKAYDNWYDSQYRYTKGLSEGNAKIKESLDSYKQISSIQGEIKDLKLIIENPDSSKEQVEGAKSRLEEIKKLLSKEYNLVINTDNSGLDDAVDAARKLTRSELEKNISEQDVKLSKALQEDVGYENKIKDINKQLAEQNQWYIEQNNILSELYRLQAEVTKGNISTEEAYKQANQLAYKGNYTTREIEYMNDDEKLKHLVRDYKNNYVDSRANQITKLSDQKSNLEGSHAEISAIAEELANWQTEIIDIAVKSGDSQGVQDALDKMHEYIKAGELDIEGYAKAAAQAMNGIDLETAWEQGGEALDNFANDYVSAMKEFGASAEEMAVGEALIREGFHSIEEAAAEKGGLDKVTAKANELAHSMGDIPEDKNIEISANGDISIIDTATGKIQELQQSDGTVIRVDADGNVEMLDRVGNQVAFLQDIGAVEIRVNAETGDVEALDKAGNVVANLSKQDEQNVNINVTANTDSAKATITDLKNEKVEVSIDGDAKAAQKVIDGLKGQTITLNIAATGAVPKANGDMNFAGGLAMINDQVGVADNRELIEHNGSLYLFDGKNVVLNLDKHDKVYTAQQTKKIMNELPHFATGSNNKSFNTAKDDFEYRQKTSVVTNSEALLWWKQVLENYASDVDVVREANIEIYELTNKINDEAIRDYQNRIKKQESDSKDWMDYEIKMHNLSIDEQIAAYERMNSNYLSTLQEMITNTDMTTEELQEAWDGYYAAIRDHEMKIADLRKEKLKEAHQDSLNYIDERTYYNDWDNHNDSPEAAYGRMKDRYVQALQEGKLTENEYNELLTEAGQQLYEGRLENSKKWLEQQYKYGAITEEEYRAGLQRVKDYTEDYYKKGIISGQFYYDSLDEANSNLFDNMSSALEAYVDEYYKQQKSMLQARREEIEAEYDAMEDAEKKNDRAKELAELQAQHKKYQNAVTVEGKRKLKEIQDNIDSLRKEEEKEAREAEKQSRLSEIDKESEKLEAEQEESLKGISKYTAQALGIISGGNTEMTSKFNTIVEAYNTQQAQLAQTGYDTISKIVDMTNLKLSEIGQGVQGGGNADGDINVEIKQTFHQNISDETTAMAYGKYAGASVRNLNIDELIPRKRGS